MPRNGSGSYNFPSSTWSPGVNGVTATTADYNNQQTDLAAAITQSVSADGQTPMTGNLAMGGNKVTGLAAGTANTDAVNLGQTISNAGQCRLVKVGSNIVLQPFQGNRLTINGVVYSIPAAGVSLAPSGTTPGTQYYIYAWMNAGVMTLEYSTTGHSADTTTGVEIKTGDPTHTLVGQARPITGPAWQFTGSQLFVASWFNRAWARGASLIAAGTPITSTSYIELNSSGRLEFLSWSDSVLYEATMPVSHGTASGVASAGVALDNNTAINNLSDTNFQAFTGGANGNTNFTSPIQVGEGYHFLTALGKTNTGTATWSNYSQQVVVNI